MQLVQVLLRKMQGFFGRVGSYLSHHGRPPKPSPSIGPNSATFSASWMETPVLAQVHLGFFVVQLKALEEAYRGVQANAAGKILSLVNMPAHV